MSRCRDNIHMHSDGRWKGRYISGRNKQGKAVYKSVYTHCAEKLRLTHCGLLSESKPITVGKLFTEWRLSRKNKVKQSTFVNYLTLYNNYMCERFCSASVENLNAFMLNRFMDDMLTNGGNKGLGLSARTVQAVMIMLRSVLEYGELEFDLPNVAKHITLPKVQHTDMLAADRLIQHCAKISELVHSQRRSNEVERWEIKIDPMDIAKALIECEED